MAATVSAPAPAMPDLFWDQPVDEIYRATGATQQGLSDAETTRRLRAYGPNDIGRKERSPVLEFLHFLTNPLVLILLFASIVSAVTGEYVNAGLITTIVCVSVVIDFWQAYRSEQAASHLRAMVTTRATV